MKALALHHTNNNPYIYYISTIPLSIIINKSILQADAEAAEKAENDRKWQTPTITLKPYSEDNWRGDPDLVDLRHRVNDKFRQNFKIGIENYVKGNWPKAKEVFKNMVALSLNNGAGRYKSTYKSTYKYNLKTLKFSLLVQCVLFHVE